MRVPDGLMSHMVGQQMSRVSSRLARLQGEVSSGLRIMRPSDDPAGALRAAGLRSGLAQVDQFQTAAQDAAMWLKSEDVALGDIQNLVRQIRALGLQGANPLTPEARETLGKQIDTLTTALIQTANATDGMRSLFGGFQTTAAPFSGTPGAVVYQGDAGRKTVTIGEGMALDLNHTGVEVFNVSSGGAPPPDSSIPDLFQTIADLGVAVRNGDLDSPNGINAKLGELDVHSTRILTARAETGNRLGQANLALDRLTQNKAVLSDLLGSTEGSDISEALVQLHEQQNVFQAASFVASTLSQGGLLQWLR